MYAALLPLLLLLRRWLLLLLRHVVVQARYDDTRLAQEQHRALTAPPVPFCVLLSCRLMTVGQCT